MIFLNVITIYSQNDFEKYFEGNWKLKSLVDNNTLIDFAEYVKFENNKVHFFKIESGKDKSLDEKNIIIKNSFGGTYEIKFENGEVWKLRLRKINNETRLIWNIVYDKDGSFILQIDDRGGLKDSNAKKKALENEINTYYIKK